MFTCSGTTDNWLCAIITILRKEITCLGDRNMPRDDKVGIQCHPIAAIASRFFHPFLHFVITETKKEYFKLYKNYLAL